MKAANLNRSLIRKRLYLLRYPAFFGNFEALDQVEANFNKYYPNVTFSYEQIGGKNLSEFVRNNSYLDIFMTSREHLRYPGMTEQYVADKCADLTDIVDTGAIREDRRR